MKINRNELCWCHSGKKYKKCHLEFDEKVNGLVRKGYPRPPRSIIRSSEQIRGIKKSCKLTKDILDSLEEIIRPGITTESIDKWVYEKTVAKGAKPAPLNYKGYPKSTCTSINEVICHGIPENRVLIEGDILNVDVSCVLDGFYGDSCRMYCIGEVSSEAKQLIKVTKECLELAIKQVKPLNTINDIGAAIEDHAKKYNYGIVEMFGGHGVGVHFHEDPFIPHYRHPDKQMILVPNMTFSIEPMINIGTHDGKILKDGWTAVTKDGSLSAQWEHMVLVTETGHEVLTA